MASQTVLKTLYDTDYLQWLEETITSNFPLRCPYSLSQLLDKTFLPNLLLKTEGFCSVNQNFTHNCQETIT